MMTTTFLLDLDNTLLGNNMKDFLPLYFAGLECRLGEYIKGKNFRQLMIASVQVLRANQDPTVTNMEAFMADFLERLGQPLGVVQPALDAFYREDYPALQQVTVFWPEARQLVQALLDRGWPVVIATNPLFPEIAIRQRMVWAGINDFPYALVTTMENSHFSKPNPAYYREILEKIGSRPEQTWMVGDRLDNDILPARTLGLKSWWITTESGAVSSPADFQGSLADLLAWLEAGGD